MQSCSAATAGHEQKNIRAIATKALVLINPSNKARILWNKSWHSLTLWLLKCISRRKPRNSTRRELLGFMPRVRRGIQHAAAYPHFVPASEILDHPPSRVMSAACLAAPSPSPHQHVPKLPRITFV